jgi:hypothetical protein
MRELGWAEGANVEYHLAYSDGDLDKMAGTPEPSRLISSTVSSSPSVDKIGLFRRQCGAGPLLRGNLGSALLPTLGERSRS